MRGEDSLEPARSANPPLATKSIVDATVAKLPMVQARSRSNQGSWMEEEMSKQGVSQRKGWRALDKEGTDMRQMAESLTVRKGSGGTCNQEVWRHRMPG